MILERHFKVIVAVKWMVCLAEGKTATWLMLSIKGLALAQHPIWRKSRDVHIFSSNSPLSHAHSVPEPVV